MGRTKLGRGTDSTTYLRHGPTRPRVLPRRPYEPSPRIPSLHSDGRTGRRPRLCGGTRVAGISARGERQNFKMYITVRSVTGEQQRYARVRTHTHTRVRAHATRVRCP